MLQFVKKLKLHIKLVPETVRKVLKRKFICGHLQVTVTYKSIFTTGTSFQPAITCSKLTVETLGQSVKYVQS